MPFCQLLSLLMWSLILTQKIQYAGLGELKVHRCTPQGVKLLYQGSNCSYLGPWYFL